MEMASWGAGGKEHERHRLFSLGSVSSAAGARSSSVCVQAIPGQVSGQLLVGRSSLKSVPSLLSLLIAVLDKSEGRAGLGGREEVKQL